MTANLHGADAPPDHLKAERHPHLVGKTVSLRYGHSHYTLAVGNLKDRLTLQITVRKGRTPPRKVDLNDDAKLTMLPDLVVDYALLWFEQTVAAPQREPLLFDAADLPLLIRNLPAPSAHAA